MPAHRNLTGADLHEPKGVATAAAGTVYVANGAGSGSWQPIELPTPPPPVVVVDSNTQLPVSAKGSMVVSDGSTWPVVAVGTPGQVLTADPNAGPGVAWKLPVVGVNVTQAAHGFTTGTPVCFNGTTWVAAKADSADTIGTHVVQLIDTDHFVAVMCGVVTGMSGLSAGEWYLVSETTPGLLTTTPPTSGFSNPIGQALTVDSLMVFPYRAQEIV